MKHLLFSSLLIAWSVYQLTLSPNWFLVAGLMLACLSAGIAIGEMPSKPSDPTKSQNYNFNEDIEDIKDLLLSGVVVIITSPIEDDRISPTINALKSHGLPVECNRQTRKYPLNPLIMELDEFGNDAGMGIVEQTDKFIGWKLSLPDMEEELTEADEC